MDSTLSKPRNWLLSLRELIDRGLWPYTADPATTGLHVIGEPAPDTPLILEGNSRHTLGRLRRVLEEGGGRVFLLDTGGLDLYQALSAGRLERDMVLSTLPASEVQEEGGEPADSEAELEDGAEPVPYVAAQALLPYPVWEALGGERLLEAGIAAGPASPEALHLFLNGGALDEPMRERTLPLRERLHLALAHAALLLLAAAGPLLFVGWTALLTGMGSVLLAVMAIVLLLPVLHRRLRSFKYYRPWLPLLLTAPLIGVLVAGASAIMGLTGTGALLLGLAATGGLTWMGALVDSDIR